MTTLLDSVILIDHFNGIEQATAYIHGLGEESYEVEFTALNGETVTVTSVYAEQVRPARPREMPHARTMG